MKRFSAIFFFLTVIFISKDLSAQTSLVNEAGNYALLEPTISRIVKEIEPSLIDFRRDLHKYPELSNRESRTSRVVAEKLRSLGFENIRTGVASCGIVAVLKGGLPGPVVAYRADMDALPIFEANDVAYKSQNQNVMHACGHDVHTTIALGIAETLSKIKDRIPGTITFLFQPAEEGPPGDEVGGAGLMIKEGALDNPRAQAIFGCHVEAEIGVGDVCLLSGPTMASTDDIKIVIHGKNSHGAKPHEGIDAIVVAANVINALQTIRSRRVDPREAFVLTLGTIVGGIRSNIIADKVEMQGTLRVLDEKIQNEAHVMIRKTAEGICSGMDASCTVLITPDYPITFNDSKLASEALAWLKPIIGVEHMVLIKPHTGAEDFSKYQKVIPGLFLFFGVANKSKNITSAIHTPTFDVDESCIPAMTRTMSLMLLKFLTTHK
ncbi:MAG: amidohydrolase [Candidatus Ozemobacteraceae bacterium]